MILDWQPVFDRASLPIYRQDRTDRSLFYTPGFLAILPAGLADGFQAQLIDSSPVAWPGAAELRQHASQAQKAWDAMKSNPFTPLCLTLYLSNSCNLKCEYCFSQPYRSNCTSLSLEVICAAAEIVARNCAAQGEPLTVVFHGGGEPTLEYDFMLQALGALEGIATNYNLDLFRYIATNGVMTQARANDLARRFDLIGLSCDGPDDIQNTQRPLRKKSWRGSARFVEQTARAIHAAGKPLHVRATITPESFERQTEIAEYVCLQLRPQEIHVEPVYAGGDKGSANVFDREQAEAYVNAFLQARQTARAYGVKWVSSGSRPQEIHCAYCHIWRNVLNLMPEGIASACFKLSEATAVRERGAALGSWDEQDGRFRLDREQIDCLKGALDQEPEDCILCFNRYHCARQCPDSCFLDTDARADGFRCRTQALLADAIIQERAGMLVSGQNKDTVNFGRIVEL